MPCQWQQLPHPLSLKAYYTCKGLALSRGFLQERQRTLHEYRMLSVTARRLPEPELELALVGGADAGALSHAPNAHKAGQGMLCDRCLQPIDADAYQANVDRLQVRSGDLPWGGIGLQEF